MNSPGELRRLLQEGKRRDLAARRAERDLDGMIAQVWQVRASGVQVNLLDIPAIFRKARLAVAAGTPLTVAIDALIATYRKN